MKKNVLREYLKNRNKNNFKYGIEHDGTNFGNKQVIEGATGVIEVKPKKRTKKGDK